MDPGAPPADGVCHFFRLPAELRNSIYEYALYNPDGLVCRQDLQGGSHLFRFYPRGAFDAAPGDDQNDGRKYESEQAFRGYTAPLEANQLKYISRQMNQETKDTILQNDLLFDEGSCQFLTFLDTLSKFQRSLPHTITVTEPHRDPLSFLDKKSSKSIVKFCELHPAFTVHVVLNGWCLHRRNILEFSLVLAERLRSGYVDRFNAVSRTKVHVHSGFWLKVGASAAPFQLPSNVRIFPVDARVNERVLRLLSRSHWRRHDIGVKVALIRYFITNGL